MEETTRVEVDFREDQMGKKVLHIDGYKYKLNSTVGDTGYWRCFYWRCKGRAIVKAGKLKAVTGVHSECLELKKTKKQPEAKRPKLILESSTSNFQGTLMKNENNTTQHLCTEGPIALEDLLLASSSDSSVEAELTLTPNSSFLELAEDKTALKNIQVTDEEMSAADAKWKRRILAGLKVYSESEQIRRFNIAYDNRKAWCENRRRFNEKLSGFHEKWANSNIKWSYSRDWPTRSHCEKLITPERGSGFYAEQPLVPIRTMRKVEAPPKLAIASEDKSKVKSIVDNDVQVLGGNRQLESVERCRNSTAIDDLKELTLSEEKPCKTFTSNGTLKKHISPNSKRRIYLCTICKKIFRKAEIFNFHILNSHQEELKNVECDLTSSKSIYTDASPLKRKRNRILPKGKDWVRVKNLSLSSNVESIIDQELKRREQQEICKSPGVYFEQEHPAPNCKLTFKDLKYADLQPKVVLSESLNLLIAQIASEVKPSIENDDTPLSPLSFHTYANHLVL